MLLGDRRRVGHLAIHARTSAHGYPSSKNLGRGDNMPEDSSGVWAWASQSFCLCNSFRKTQAAVREARCSRALKTSAKSTIG